MKIGTKSVLFGAHCFFFHPFCIALGWWKLYGFPWDPRLWVCFFVHDLGYFGKPNMDGPEGETHPEFGAAIVRRLFGDWWGEFCLCHSRFYAKRLGRRFSRLCVADKMAIVVTPTWLYIPMVRATGELAEYMGMQRESKYHEMGFDHTSPARWHQSVKRYILAWIEKHKTADCEDGWLKGNGTEVSAVLNPKTAGYLEGGYVNNKYIVTKSDGTPISPSARYMVVRYDRDRDPHGIFATLAYAISVEKDNPELADGIIEALALELGLTSKEFYETYNDTIKAMMAASFQFHS